MKLISPTPPPATASVPWAPSLRWVLASLSLSMLLSSLGTSIANVGLPTLALAFHATFQEVQWVVLAYLLAITTLIVSVGRLGDLLGRRRLLLAGLGVFTTASALCGLAPTLGWLIAARAAQGLGAATMLALSMALVGESVPKARTGSAMGLLGTMSAVGTAMGPSLGGVLIASAGWRPLFWVNVPLGILAIVLTQRHLPADGPRSSTSSTRFDVRGTVVLALTLAAYALAMTLGRGSPGTLNGLLLLAAVLGVGIFVRIQSHAASPLIRLAILRDPHLRASLVTNALVSTVLMSTLVVAPFYLSGALGFRPALVGAIMALGPVISIFSGVPAGRTVDRWGAPRMLAVGLVAMVLGTLALVLLPPLLGVGGYMVGIAVLTPGYQLFQAANNTAVMADVAPDQRGVISGLLSLARNLGFITGASFMGAVFALTTHTADITAAKPEAIATGMQATFAVAAMLIAVALAVATRAHALAVRRAHPPM
jgi:MFS family permease